MRNTICKEDCVFVQASEGRRDQEILSENIKDSSRKYIVEILDVKYWHESGTPPGLGEIEISK